MYMYVYVCMCVYVYIYIHTHMCVYIYIYIYIYVHISYIISYIICIYVYIYIYGRFTESSSHYNFRILGCAKPSDYSFKRLDNNYESIVNLHYGKMAMCVCIYMYIYTYMYIDAYIYIYIYRERERERETFFRRASRRGAGDPAGDSDYRRGARSVPIIIIIIII